MAWDHYVSTVGIEFLKDFTKQLILLFLHLSCGVCVEFFFLGGGGREGLQATNVFNHLI